jgi:hypothetical protein
VSPFATVAPGDDVISGRVAYQVVSARQTKVRHGTRDERQLGGREPCTKRVEDGDGGGGGVCTSSSGTAEAANPGRWSRWPSERLCDSSLSQPCDGRRRARPAVEQCWAVTRCVVGRHGSCWSRRSVPRPPTVYKGLELAELKRRSARAPIDWTGALRCSGVGRSWLFSMSADCLKLLIHCMHVFSGSVRPEFIMIG